MVCPFLLPFDLYVDVVFMWLISHHQPITTQIFSCLLLLKVFCICACVYPITKV